MLLIISHEDDMSTNHVIDWLIYYKVSFIRVNREEKFYISQFTLGMNSFECELTSLDRDFSFNLHKIESSWYRRGDIKITNSHPKYCKIAKIQEFIDIEYQTLHDFIFRYVECLPRIDNFFYRSLK